MNFKKNKVFTAVLAVFAAIFVAGLVFCVIQVVAHSQNSASIESATTALKKLSNRGDAFALTEENVAAEKANKDKLAAAKEKKLKAVMGAKWQSLVPNVDGDAAGTFSSTVLDAVNKEANELHAGKIVLADQAKFFGFSRYLQSAQAPKPSPDSVSFLAMEKEVIFTLTKALVSARKDAEDALRGSGVLAADKRLALMLKDVRREAGEFPSGAGTPGTAIQKDEIFVLEKDFSAGTGLYLAATATNSRGAVFSSLRRKDSVKATVFQVGFVSTTAVLRNFIKQFSGGSEYPIYIREISVKPAESNDLSAINFELNPAAAQEAAAPEEAAPAMDFNFLDTGNSANAASAEEAPAAPALPEKFSVQPESISEFLVTFEFVAPAETKAEAAEKEEGE